MNRGCRGEPEATTCTTLVDPVLGLGPVVLGASLSGTLPTMGGVAASLLLFAAAVALLYALVVALTALAVLLVGADELGTVSCSVVESSA